MESDQTRNLNRYQIFIRGDREYYESLVEAGRALAWPNSSPARLGRIVLDSAGYAREITEREVRDIKGLADAWNPNHTAEIETSTEL